MNGKQCKSWSECSFSLIWVYIVCPDLSIWKLTIFIEFVGKVPILSYNIRNNVIFYTFIMSPQPKGSGGTYCFWCRSCWRLCSFLSALYLLNQWVDFDQTCTNTLLGVGKEVIKFWWLWPHFQGHTSTLNYQILTKKSLSAPYLSNQITDSGETSYIVMLGWFKDLRKFWWHWPNFQGHHTIKTVKMSLVCTLSPEPIGGFWLNLQRNTTVTLERNDSILVTLTSFSRPHQHFECQILTKKKLVCTQSLEPNNGFWPNFMYCIIGIIKMIRFWWPWPNFQGHHTEKAKN